MTRNALAVAMVAFAPLLIAQNRTKVEPAQSGRLEPDSPAVRAAPAPELSEAERAAMLNRHLALREQAARQSALDLPSPPGLPQVQPAETIEAPVMGESNPSGFVVGRNNQNLRANTSGLASTTSEPAAANEGIDVFYTSNWQAGYSTNGGSSYTAVTIPAGPSNAPNFCCDQDVIYDKSHAITFWSVLYLNSAQNNGVVRIYVIKNIPSSWSCSYTFDPGGSSNVVPDFPHLGLSTNYLYLTLNNLTNGTTWTNSQVIRLTLDQLADCTTVTTNTYTYTGTVGQRVFVPAGGARLTMYWGSLDNSSTFRIFSWPESSTSVSSSTTAIQTSTNNSPDCRGGANNTNWFALSTSYSIQGFTLRGAVGASTLYFYWNASNDATYPNALVRAAVFNQSGYAVVNQPHIWSSSFCFGYPAVSANQRGDVGLSIAWGGKNGGSGPALVAGVGIADDYSSSAGFFGSVTSTATGTHQPPDGRYGDFLTVRPHQPCDLWWTAENFAYLNGSAATNVNARYVEFGRNRDQRCWSKVNSFIPPVLP